MGYTHYFPQNKEVPLEQWAAFKADVLRLFDVRPSSFETTGSQYDEKVTLCDGNGEIELTQGSQLFEVSAALGEMLIFNGDDREGRGLGHETMLLRQKRDPAFQFCKTARKPYDWFVVAVLLLAHKHCPIAGTSVRMVTLKTGHQRLVGWRKTGSVL